MIIDVEERLRRAATLLDDRLGATQPAVTASEQEPLPDAVLVGSGSLVESGRAGQRRWAAFALAALSLVAVGVAVAVERDADDEGVTLRIAANPSAADTWSFDPDIPLRARSQHLAVSTGTGALVWGGYNERAGGEGGLSDGAYFDNTDGSWRRLPNAPLDDIRGDAIGVWTGAEVVVLNGVSGRAKAAAFDPVRFAWRALPDPPIANAANAVSRLLYLDGAVIAVGVSDEVESSVRNQVALLDLDANRWSIGQSPPVGFGSDFDAVVAGDEIVVVSRSTVGGKSCGTLGIAAYRPDVDRWLELPVGPAVSRLSPVVAWTGTELFVGGGATCDSAGIGDDQTTATADLLDLRSGTWRPTSPAPSGFAGSFRYGDPWTGHSVVVMQRDGSPLLYHAATDQWHLGPPLVTALGDSRARGLDVTETPVVAVAGRLLIAGGMLSLERNGSDDRCCELLAGSYTYRPPDGY